MRTAEGRTILEAEEYCIAHYISSGHFTHGMLIYYDEILFYIFVVREDLPYSVLVLIYSIVISQRH